MNVSYNDIHKRKMVRESTNSIYITENENCKLYLARYKQNHSMELLEKFFNECSKSAESCNKYSKVLFDYTEKFSTSNPKLERILVENIAPKLTEYHNAPECISEQIRINNICDRILNNHEKIISNSNILEQFATARDTDYAMLIYSTCESVNNFKLSTTGKVAVAIEEVSLLSNMNNLDISKEEIGNKVFRYFAIKENASKEDIAAAAEKNNNTLSEYISSIANNEYGDLFMLSPVKNIDYLIKVINASLVGKNKSIARFIVGIPKVFDLIKDILVSTENMDLCNDILDESFFIENIYNLFEKEYLENEEVKDGIKAALSAISKEMDNCNAYTNSNNFIKDDVKSRFVKYALILKTLKSKFSELDSMIYPKYNAAIVNRVSEGVDIDHYTIYFDPAANSDFWLINPSSGGSRRLLGENNTVSSNNKDTIHKALTYYIEASAECIQKNLMSRLSRNKQSLFVNLIDGSCLKESKSIHDLIDLNYHTIDATISLYETSGMTGELMNLCDDIVRNINESLKYNGLEVYFINMDYFVEFRIHSDVKVVLTESELSEEQNWISPVNMYLMDRILEFANLNVSPISVDDIQSFIESEKDDSIDLNDIMEVVSYTKIDREMIKTINEGNISIREQNIINRYEPVSKSNDITTLYAFDCLNNILNEAKDNAKDNKTGTEKKSGFKGIDVNNVKLYLKAFQDKVKNLGTKEREISRNLDAAVNHFIKAVQDTIKADSREQIIKGSLIPSFSKCVKIAIVAAGSFAIASAFGASFAPIAPVIVIFGALAGSKMLMQSEKNALIDELEVELQVIEREIQNCESENKPKKLRALLKTQKDLQRQYQRLKLGTNVSKTLQKKLASSNVGVTKKD